MVYTYSDYVCFSAHNIVRVFETCLYLFPSVKVDPSVCILHQTHTRIHMIHRRLHKPVETAPASRKQLAKSGAFELYRRRGQS
jgi:hypothetical protein